MPGFESVFTLFAAAAVATGNYFFGDNNATRDSYYLSYLYNSGTFFLSLEFRFCAPRSLISRVARHLYTANSGTSRNQTQQSHRPPQQSSRPYLPSSSYSQRPPATNALGQTRTAPRPPAPPGYYSCPCGAHHPSVVSPYTRSSSQSQPSTRTQALRPPSSFFDNVEDDESLEYGYTPTRSSSQTRQSTRTQASRPSSSFFDNVDDDESLEYGYTPTRPSSQTQQSTRTQASRPSSSFFDNVEDDESPEYGYPSTRSSGRTQPSAGTLASRPNSSLFDSAHDDEPPEYGYPSTRPSSQTRPSARTQASHPYYSIFDSVHAYESPEYGYSYTRTPSQTQPSTRLQPFARTQPSTRTQASRLYSSLFKSVNTHESLEYEYSQTVYSQTGSQVPSHRDVHTSSEPCLPTAPAAVSSDPCSDEPSSVENLDFAKKLREQARRKGREMSEARSRAKSAQKKGSRGAAKEHRQRANAHQSAMNELDKRAAEIIFREKNKNRKDGMIDLHGLHVSEAIRHAKDQVQTARLRGDDVVRFIVGKGLHADDGEAKIRPALEGFFTKQGLVHSLDSKNTGVLVVRLD